MTAIKDFLLIAIAALLMAVAMVSCIKADNDWQLEQDKLALEQRLEKGQITYEQYHEIMQKRSVRK